jgi:hypothetical protein
MLIEQCVTELQKLWATARAAALHGDGSGAMDQRRVCQMMLIGTQPGAFGGQRAGEMKADVLLDRVGCIGALLAYLFAQADGKVLRRFGFGFSLRIRCCR